MQTRSIITTLLFPVMFGLPINGYPTATPENQWPVVVKSECEIIAPGVLGAEDLALINNRYLLVSAAGRREGEKTIGLCTVDLGAGSTRCDPVTYSDDSTPPEGPHGIFAFGEANHEVVVIDHHQNGNRILRYRFDQNVLTETRPPLELVDINANDIVVDQFDRYFFSDPPGEQTSGWNWLKALLGFKRSGVNMISGDQDSVSDGEQEVICRRLRYPNGVALDAKNRLYLADTLAGRLYMLDQSHASGLNQRCWAVSSVKGADNISISDSSRFEGLLIAGHPSLWGFLEHEKSADDCSPTEVHAIANGGKDSLIILKLSGEEKYRSSDRNEEKLPFCAGSSAILTDVLPNAGPCDPDIEKEPGFLYVGQVFGEGVLRCPVMFRSMKDD